MNDNATLLGGTEVQLLALREGLRQRGHDARVFASSAQTSPGERFADYECFGTISRFRTLLQTANPWAFFRLRRVLKEFKPDVVHVKIFMTQLSPLILPLLKNIPSLFSVDWYKPICLTGTKLLPDDTVCRVSPGVVCRRNRCLPLRDWFPLMLQRKLWLRWKSVFSRITAVSQAVKERLTEEKIEPVEVIWNGVCVRSPRPPLATPPTVAFAGYLVRVKGARVLVQAFAKVKEQLPEARLLIAGQGPESRALQELISNLDLASSVSLLGHLTRDEMERRFAGAWVQAVPSLWEDPFSNGAAEAMMRGTAVVASASGSLNEMIDEGQTGLLFKPGDVDALAAALLRLLQNRSLAEEMGRAGRKKALSFFSEETYVDKVVNLYERMVQNR